MTATTNIAKSLIPISLFNKGQASRIFDRLRTVSQLIVLKNNQPTAVILAPEEYERLSEIEEDYVLLAEAYERLEKNGNNHGIPMADVMARHGITQEELDKMEDVAIE